MSPRRHRRRGARPRRLAPRRTCKLRDDVRGGQLRVRSRVPLRRCGGEALLGRVGVAWRRSRRRRRAARPGSRRARPSPSPRRRKCSLPPKVGDCGQHGELHSRQAAYRCRTSRCHSTLAARVEAPVRLADQPEFGGLLERHLLRHRQLRRSVGERAVAELAAAGRVHHSAVLRPAGGRIDVPALRGRRDQHDARRRARVAQRDVHARESRWKRQSSGRRSADSHRPCRPPARARSRPCRRRPRAPRQPASAATCTCPGPSRSSVRRTSPCRRDRCAGMHSARRHSWVPDCARRQAEADQQAATDGGASAKLEDVRLPRGPHATPAAFLIAARMRG